MIFFIDLNETLVRTGEVPLSDRLEEQRQLERCLAACRQVVVRHGPFDLVLLTGNSFEYARRVEEPLGLHNLPGVRLIVVSENGLIARDFKYGDRWRAQTVPAYDEAVARFITAAAEDAALGGRFFTQGNEIRLTLKPVANEFESAQLNAGHRLAAACELEPVARIYTHRFYFDVDPLEVEVEGLRVPAHGKAYAVGRLAEPSRPLVAIGDSASDLPMFTAVLERGGKCFAVANAQAGLGREQGVESLPGSFAEGVAQVLERLAAASSTTSAFS